MHKGLFYGLILVCAALLALPAAAQDDLPDAAIINDEGGTVAITGTVSYSNPFFTDGVTEPLVILEDQTGFVLRQRDYLFPPASQVLGQITSDFYQSPFSYSIPLPIEPQAPLNDVDNDDEQDAGVMIFAIAYWDNTFGDTYLEERDLFGGGWSGAYASTRVDQNPSGDAEYLGGKVLIYAPDDQQGFPSGFGADELLFTDDDPIVRVPQGYSIVEMDSDPFTFDRSRSAVVDLIEGEGAEVDDFSSLSYTEAFDAMIEKFRNEYAFTEFKGLDWDALSAEFRPRIEAAEANADPVAYEFAMQDFIWSIPDGHVSVSQTPAIGQAFQEATAGGLGMAIRELDDGRVITNYILVDGPADQAGIELRAEILTINGEPISDAISRAQAWSAPFSTPWYERLQQMRYAIRFPLGTSVDITYQNPGDAEPTTVTLDTIEERASFAFSSFSTGLTGFELPLEWQILDSGYVYVKIYSFFDNANLTIDLWERMLTNLNQSGANGLIIDMRQNGGGRGFLADQMAAYFFDEPHVLGNAGIYDEELGEFYFDPEFEDRYFLAPEQFRYRGPIAVLVGPACVSACEFFSYNMTIENRAAIVGQYPTGGLGGGVEQFYMPGGLTVQMTVTRAVDAEGSIHIEGQGVAPDVLVPVNEDTLFAENDVILDAAVEYLSTRGSSVIAATADIAIGDEVSSALTFNNRDRYLLTVEEDTIINITLTGAASDFDSYLRIYDANDTLIAGNDDTGDTFDSAVEGLEVAAGTTLIIEVGTFNDAGEGEYTLTVGEAE